ncbi:MAG: M48 family metallopeptidase [Elusimicrobiaceae bacterium]
MGNETKVDTATTISEIQLFIQKLKADLPEVFGKETTAEKGNPPAAKIMFKGTLRDYILVQDPDVAGEVLERDNAICVHCDSETNPATVLENWMRTLAEEVLAERVKMWSEKMGVSFNRICVKDQKTLWGSCSEKSNLNFSWRIIKAPDSVLDYLVIHELAHLKHLNHKTEFWQFVEQFCPDYKKQRQWLHEYKDNLFTEIPAAATK